LGALAGDEPAERRKKKMEDNTNYKGRWIVFINGAAGDAYYEEFPANPAQNYFDSHGYYSEDQNFASEDEAATYVRNYNAAASRRQLEEMPYPLKRG
jgi:hypothetical protein